MSREPRNWLCLITSDREFENVAELTEDIWTHFDGICAVVHRQGGDDKVKTLLEDRKKAGFVKEVEWTWHHGHSMNHWLLDPRIRLMDACWIRDSTERFNPEFTVGLKGLAADLLQQNIWNLAQWSKLLMFRRWYNQQFVNGLHWGLMGTYGPTIAMEKMSGWSDPRKYAYSVRDEKRPKDHRYMHEVKYLLDYGPNGNHLALFHPDPKTLDAHQWDLYELIAKLEEAGVRTAEEFKIYLQSGKSLDRRFKELINGERPLRNFYRYFVLGHSNEEILKDEDMWRIPL